MKYISKNTGKEYDSTEQLVKAEGISGGSIQYNIVEEKEIYVPKNDEIIIDVHPDDFDYFHDGSQIVREYSEIIQAKLKNELGIDVTITVKDSDDE